MADYIRDSAKLGANDTREDPPVKVTATEARQGYLGRPVLVVLVVGLLLALVAWAGAEYFGTSIAPPSETSDPATLPSAVDPAANDNTVNDNQPAGEPTESTPAIQDSTRQ